mgnify:CR=1 FL=1
MKNQNFKAILTKISFGLLLTFGCLIAGTNQSFAQPAHLVISQVYGGGGNTGAPYTNDFVELFNPTASTVSVTGMSVQYASATGTTWAVAAITGSIAPGKYYLKIGRAHV